jgi:hypothetical protein
MLDVELLWYSFSFGSQGEYMDEDESRGTGSARKAPQRGPSKPVTQLRIQLEKVVDHCDGAAPPWTPYGVLPETSYENSHVLMFIMFTIRSHVTLTLDPV